MYSRQELIELVEINYPERSKWEVIFVVDELIRAEKQRPILQTDAGHLALFPDTIKQWEENSKRNNVNLARKH